jgi:hypothetical protein
VLGGAGALGAAVATPDRTPRAPTTIDAVARDTAALDALRAARARVVANAVHVVEQSP